MKNLSFEKTVIKDGFWKFSEDLNRNRVVHSVYERFKETGRFDALKCLWKEGDANKPHIFWDSDVAKWIEDVGYFLKKYPCEELERLVDEMVDDIAKNQREDGYFNSYCLAVNPDGIYQNRGDHELYCTGHLIEAAISYHQATGKDTLLNCMLRNIDCIYRVFVEEKSANFVTPGHEEIELALLKLYHYLGNKKYLELARFLINQRGNNEKDPDNGSMYHQSNAPVRELTEAVGHCVRAGYLYTAMAMLANLDQDTQMEAACRRLFDDITTKKMSIAGSIGSDNTDESFSYAYDLPNDVSYNETCAAIALAMFAGEMQELEANSNIQDNSGRYAVMRGPVVYCMEGVDNGKNLRDITLIDNGKHCVETEEEIPAPVLYLDACRRKTTDKIYRIKNAEREFFTARLIPYFSFANRQATDLLVWCMVT